MIRIDRHAIRSDLRRNGLWLASMTIVMGLLMAQIHGRSFLLALPILAIIGLVMRYAWAGWLGFGKA